MEYKVRFDVDGFPWRGGAVDRIAEARMVGKTKELAAYLETAFEGRVPTAAEINDFMWFEGDSALRDIGVYERDEGSEDCE